MRVEEIVEGKEYRLLTDIGGVGYTPDDAACFNVLPQGAIVTVNKVVTDLYSDHDGNWPHAVIVTFGKDGYVDLDGEDDTYEVAYTGLVSPNFLEEV